MRIAICDDEKTHREYLGTYVKEWSANRKVIDSILYFESSEEFYFHWCEKQDIDLLLLDIQMGKQNGVELARKIRETNKNLQIIFITGLSEYACEGYDVDALNYLIKPFKKERLFVCLDQAVKLQFVQGAKLLMETKEGLIGVFTNDIWYIEAFSHSCIVASKDKAYEVKQSIGSFENKPELKKSFIRCHRSFLVNIEHVYQITKNTIVLDNKKEIPVSRNAYKMVAETFVHHFRRYDVQ